MRTMLNALGARRAALQNDTDRQKGFTLIELLVVVIIIGILAAIAIPVYLGIQNSAKESGVQSDVTNAKIAVIAYQTDKGTLPAAGDITTLDAKYGLTKGDYTASLVLTVSATDATIFCIQGASNTSPVVNFGATQTAGAKKGTCTGGVFTATP